MKRGKNRIRLEGGEVTALWSLSGFLCAFLYVCVTERERRTRLSTSRDQLIVVDDGAARGQGSKPCIVSLALLSQRASPPPPLLLLLFLHPLGDSHPSCRLLCIYIHPSAACVAVAVAAARPAAACRARI